MRKNFKIDQGNALIQEEKIFDLHNCYNFSSFSVEAKKAYFRFEPNQTWGKELPPVLIKFDGLLYLELNFNFCSDTQFNSDEFELDEMGYKSPNDFDYDWLLAEKQADEEDHILFRFFGDNSVRIFASQAKLKEVQTSNSDMCTIYIRLLDEGTEVYRPTQAELLDEGILKVLPTPNYDPEDEHWEFLPGTVVRCVRRVLEDEEVLVAISLHEVG